MILLDTHVWLWWRTAPDLLSEAAQTAIDEAPRLGVCPISCWELSMKASKGRLTFDRDVRVWVTQALAHPRLVLVPLTADIAVSAGLLDADGFHGDPADRLVVATALQHGIALVTKDRAIREFPRLRAIW